LRRHHEGWQDLQEPDSLKAAEQVAAPDRGGITASRSSTALQPPRQVSLVVRLFQHNQREPMKRTFFILAAWLSLPLAATAGEPQDRAPLAPEVLRELETKWKAAVKVDSDDPDSPVVELSFSNCHAP